MTCAPGMSVASTAVAEASAALSRRTSAGAPSAMTMATGLTANRLPSIWNSSASSDAPGCFGRLHRYQQQEYEAAGLAVGWVEWHRLCKAHEGAVRFLETLDPAFRNGDSLPEPRRAETLASEQAVEHQAPRPPLVVLEQEPGLLEHAFIARHIQVQKDVRSGQELRNYVHRDLEDPAGRNRARRTGQAWNSTLTAYPVNPGGNDA